ncbi:MAG: PqqD family protein [Alphaproteobacteria bacterium]
MSALIAARADVVCCPLADGMALLDTRSSVYFTLNRVGAYVWGLLAKPMHRDDVEAAVLANFNVEEPACRRDLADLFAAFEKEGLVQATDAEHS